MSKALILERLVTAIGHNVIGSSGEGTIATNLAKKYAPNIIIMDKNLGGKFNGIETAKRISNSIRCSIIFITGPMNQELLTQAQ